jgi:hypothetical protein
MSTMVIEVYEALRKAGVDEELAKDAARAVLPADARTDLATKGDLAELSAATKGDLAELRAATKGDLAELRAATKGDLAELKAATKADLAELKADVIKWNVGALAILTAIFAAIVRLG